MKFIGAITSSLRADYKSYYVLAGILLLGIILRVYGLEDQHYWYDEIITLEVVKGSLHSIISGPRPPLYLVLADFWIEGFGTSEVATRLMSVIFGVLSIALVYSIGRSLFSRNVGLISAFFMTVSRFQIYYSQEIRYYSLFEFLTLVSFYFMIRLLKSRSYFHLALYIVSTILLYYSHDFAVFVIAAQNLYVLLRYRTLKSFYVKWFPAQLVILLGIFPRFIYAFTDKAAGDVGPGWIPPPNLFSPLGTLYNYVGIKFQIHRSLVDDIALICLLAGTLVYIFFVGKNRWLKSLRQSLVSLKFGWNVRGETMLVLLWLIVPIILALIMSELFKPMYLDRYLICSAPAYYILVALFLTKIKPAIPLAITLLSYVIMISPGLFDYYTKPVREDWREVGEYIDGNKTRSRPVVILPYFSAPGFNRYNEGNYQFCVLPEKKIDISNIFRLCGLEGIDNFWVILRKKQNKETYQSYYNHNGRNYRIEKMGEFTVSKYPPVTLYSFEKHRE